ncbi:tRNA epoxyqueuosine(34) reductase QueG [Pararhodospirillum oryzae]|uniref:Epoxyqueuosine reductase n=1 Tax=Pararhodospirillum oryzae TaxID=478448 RepID=A0A512H4F5_9PROT|nr:tRNA epoxyqueuosine(34) reductase QueG [Pararhodospirillum oryzae]GEO80332.1 epoxyqueuosine reductase [Pararhodospirillum oryzae]
MVSEKQRAQLRARAHALGFEACAITAARLPEGAGEDLRAFVAQGHHGPMAWMAETLERRADPRVLWPEAVSVVTLGLSYAPPEIPDPTGGDPTRACFSVHARHRDYHAVAKGRAKTLAQWMVSRLGGAVKVFVDTAPVMEKPLAHAAGLGWQGKHTNLVSPRFGSWLVLAEVFTTVDLPPDPPMPDRCGACRRCLDACPTGALTAPHVMDARRCLACLTIETPGPIPEPLRGAMGNRVYGCDACLAVCPWNRFAPPTTEPALVARPDLIDPPLAELAALDDPGFRARFSGTGVRRLGYARFKRNVLIALGNSGAPALKDAVAPFLDDPDPVIADAARWAWGRLGAEEGNEEGEGHE